MKEIGLYSFLYNSRGVKGLIRERRGGGKETEPINILAKLYLMTETLSLLRYYNFFLIVRLWKRLYSEFFISVIENIDNHIFKILSEVTQ
jgi:hypothetical protein